MKAAVSVDKTMLHYCFIAFIVSTVAAAAAAAAEDMTVKPIAEVTLMSEGANLLQNPGSNASFECEFRMHQFHPFDNPLIWLKSQWLINTEEWSIINIMRVLQDPFWSTGRFDVSFSQRPPNYTFALKIKDLTLEDNGNYTCEIRGAQSNVLASKTFTITVEEPVSRIYFDSPQLNSRRLTVTAGQPVDVRCIAVGGSPPPRLDIYLDWLNITRLFDISRSFQLQRRLGVDQTRRGLRTVDVTTVLKTRRFVTRVMDHELTLSCRSSSTSSTIPSVSTDVTLFVNYGPQIVCDSVDAMTGQRNVCLHCHVTARPAPTSVYWQVVGVNGSDVIGRERHVIAGHLHWAVVQVRGNEQLETTLCIRRVEPTSFRTYYVVASSQLRTTSLAVALSHKSNADSDNDAQDGVRSLSSTSLHNHLSPPPPPRPPPTVTSFPQGGAAPPRSIIGEASNPRRQEGATKSRATPSPPVLMMTRPPPASSVAGLLGLLLVQHALVCVSQ